MNELKKTVEALKKLRKELLASGKTSFIKRLDNIISTLDEIQENNEPKVANLLEVISKVLELFPTIVKIIENLKKQ